MNMKKSYIISYDLTEKDDYNKLFNHIKSYGTWAHITESTWAILSTKTVSQIRDDLAEHMSKNCRLVVIESANIAAWKNTLCSSKWLKDNV